MLIDIDDVDDTDLLIELPRAVKFIDEGLKTAAAEGGGRGGVFVHCAAGKSRSVSAIVAYLLWRHPDLFFPSVAAGLTSRRNTAAEAVDAALRLIRRSRPMAEPNDGFMEQLRIWWEMGCPDDVEAQPAYQRWAYKREVEENIAVGQAPSRLRFEDEVHQGENTAAAAGADGSFSSPTDASVSLRCKKCRRTLTTWPFVLPHSQPTAEELAAASSARRWHASPVTQEGPCQHIFIEPLSWMRPELEKGELGGRLSCPTERCGASVGRYEWKGLRCSCGRWVTPGFSLQRARVDEERVRKSVVAAARGDGDGGGGNGSGSGDDGGAGRAALGIRMPPGFGGRGGNL